MDVRDYSLQKYAKTLNTSAQYSNKPLDSLRESEQTATKSKSKYEANSVNPSNIAHTR